MLPPQHKLGPVIGAGWRFAGECLAWSVAVAWCVRTRALLMNLGQVPDLSRIEWDLCPVGGPGLIVVVPAKNEAETLKPAMETLLAQDYPWLRIIAVDDQSTDGTGYLLEELAAAHPGKLEVVHLTETAEGWMGKTFALEVATQRSRSEYLLFTDADVWFSPSILRRALTYAQSTRADHLVVMPTAVTQSWGERVVLGFLQMVTIWGLRPWKVADNSARRDAIGVGAFNLVRREALEELGGLAPQRLAVLEDVTLGLRMRAAEMRQRVAFAPGLVLVHWATGAFGIIGTLTKNLFALVSFWYWLLALWMAALVTLFLLPVAGLAWPPTMLPGLVTLACIGVCYRASAGLSGIDARYGWTYPLGVLALLWAMVRSAALTLWRGGVLWRGTLYPLRALRSDNNPFAWELERLERLRDERKRARKPAIGHQLRVGRRRKKI